MPMLTRLRHAMEAAGVPALFVSDLKNVTWLTGFTGSSGAALVTPDSALFLTDGRYSVQAEEQVRNMPTAIFGGSEGLLGFLAGQVGEKRIARLGFEADQLTYAGYEKLAAELKGVDLMPTKGLFVELRLVKTPEEVAKIRAACQLADQTFAHVRRMIQPGVREYDLGLDLEFYIRRNGAEVAFDPIVASGERSAMPHGRASEKRLEKGDFLTLDFGAKLGGYCSDMTRTVVLGEASPRHREIYDQVNLALSAALEMMRPGVKAGDVDARAREVLAEKDLDQYFGHSLGHGLGREVHDSGRLAKGSETMLEPGQVWTVEPGAYLPGFGGVRIEDDVVVTETGIEILTHSPKELLVLP